MVALPTLIAAATPLDETAAPGANKRLITVPTGVTTAHLGIIMAGNASGSGATLTATGWSALVANQTATNETWTVLKRLGGQTAGDTISLNPGTQSVYNVVAFWLDTGGMDIDVVGTPQVRASSIATTTAPSITVSQQEPVLLLSTERTTATGTTVTDPAGVTRLYYHEGVGSSPNVSHYAGVFDPGASGATAAQTLTYSGPSGNGAAVQVSVLPVAVPPSGSASMTLSGTGAATAPSTGSASLSFSATTTAAGTNPASGTATMSLAATGTSGSPVAATGTAALTLSAAGAQQASVTGTASMAVTAAGAAAGIAPATGSASLTVTATANAATTTSGSAVLAITAASSTLVQSWLSQQPLYVAHRGGSADWPEETLYSYGQSAAWNSKLALEVSVWQTTDGVWVCSHDQTTGRVFNGTNVDITTVAWSAISGYTTISGSQPIARLDAVLAQYATGNRVFMIDDKGQQATAALLNLLDTYGGANRFIAKGYITATTWADAAAARGYQGWGYGYDADVTNGNMGKYQSHWSTLGMDVLSATAADWTTTKSFGKIVFGHIIATAAQGNTAFTTYGANGIVASGVKEAVPNDASTGTASMSLSATGAVAPSATTGSASLTFAASAAPAAPVSGSAGMSLSAASTAGAPVTGSAALTLGAAGAQPAPTATGTAALGVTAAGTGSASAAGTAALAVTATGTSLPAAAGLASLAVTATGAAAGTATGTAGLNVSANGATNGYTLAAGTAALTVTAAGTVGARATGSVSLSLSGSGVTATPITGTAVLTVSATGGSSSPATGGISLTFTATAGAAGSIAATGTAGLVLTAAGNTSARASGAGLLTLTATAAPATGATGAGSMTLTAGGVAGNVPLPVQDADISLTAVLAPQVKWFTATLAPQH